MSNFNLQKNGIPIRKPVYAKVGGKSMTIKSHAKGLTVNEIMKRFSVTGTIPDRGVPGQFLDTSVAPSLFDSLNLRVKLNHYFMGLDAVTRAKFMNDPINLVRFVNDEKNIDKSLELGLLKLTPEGTKRKQAWDADQAKKAADKKSAFVADVKEIIKTSTAPPAV